MPKHTIFCPICRRAMETFVVPKDCFPRDYALKACHRCYARVKQEALARVEARRRTELAPLPTNQALAIARDKKRAQANARRREAARA